MLQQIKQIFFNKRCLLFLMGYLLTPQYFPFRIKFTDNNHLEPKTILQPRFRHQLYAALLHIYFHSPFNDEEQVYRLRFLISNEISFNCHFPQRILKTL